MTIADQAPQSFSFGRPPSMTLSYIDCELAEEEVMECEISIIFWRSIWLKRRLDHPWLIRYSLLLHTTMTTAFGATKPIYQVILQLDRKLRDFPPTPKMKTACGDIEVTPPTTQIHINRWLGMCAKECSKTLGSWPVQSPSLLCI